MQKGFFFDQSRCTGCDTCLIACKDWHEYDLGTDPENWIRVSTIEKGKYPDLFVAFLAQPCYHCDDPPCVSTCPVEAIAKREEGGIVIVDRDACLGTTACDTLCKTACRYDVPQFGPETDAKMQKCDLCLERGKDGNAPICVEACPMRALDAGPMDELMNKYGRIQEAEGFVYSREAKPSVIFKPKQ